jgi:1,2-diacylglycerol 3-alpha-glucosyltransferase
MNGYLYKEGDIPAIVQHIEDIITHDELYTKMSEKSLEYVQQHDIYKTLESFEKLYQDQASKS